jgi:hypothetical protein
MCLKRMIWRGKQNHPTGRGGQALEPQESSPKFQCGFPSMYAGQASLPTCICMYINVSFLSCWCCPSCQRQERSLHVERNVFMVWSELTNRTSIPHSRSMSATSTKIRMRKESILQRLPKSNPRLLQRANPTPQVQDRSPVGI